MAADAKALIRRAFPEEFEAIGRLTVACYSALAGMPGPERGPEIAGYYESLADTAGRAALPSVEILVAVDPDGSLLGSVSFIGDMRAYGGPDADEASQAASGIRMLAVVPEARGRGLGRRLTETCLERARALGRSEVALHTTEPMEVAREMYERMGFVRRPETDFGPDGFLVMGYRLALDAGPTS